MITESDQNEDLTFKLKEIEDLLTQNRKQDAIPKLEEVRTKAKKGLIFNLVSQYLAALKAERKEFKEVYEILHPIKKHLNPEAQMQLHRAAYEMKDYPLVVELAGPCFQLIPDPDIALRSAEACAALHQDAPAIGWLKAARKAGFVNLETILTKEVFKALREIPDFKKLYHS